MIAPDQTTFDYLQGRAARADRAPTGTPPSRTGRTLRTDDDAVFDAEVDLDAADADAVRHLGHQPRPGPAAVGDAVPDPESMRRRATSGSPPQRALDYMGLTAGHAAARHRGRHRLRRLVHQRPDRGPARRRRGRQGPPGRRRRAHARRARARRGCALQAEAEGLDKVFTAAGAEWRLAGCSMCLGMNPDQLAPGERSASTSNRNFEGRQGKGGRTHLVSPLVAAATAVRGTLSSPADLVDLPTPTPRGERVMDAFTTHTGVGVPLRRSNVDTDQIIPAVYLKRVTRTGFEDGLFAAWRERRDVRPQQPGVRRRLGPRRRARLRHRLLPRARRLGADELRLPGRHLARGSPTSSAATAASRACSPRRSAQDDVELLWKLPRERARAPRSPSTWCRRTVTAGDIVAPFEVDDYTRWRLLEGLDDIGLTLRHEADDHRLRGVPAGLEARRPRRAEPR